MSTVAIDPSLARDICGAIYRSFNGVRSRSEVTLQDLSVEANCTPEVLVDYIERDKELKHIAAVSGFSCLKAFA